MKTVKELGFCGLGAMGFGMAENLVKQGYKVKGFDVSEALLQRFASVGGEACKSLAASAQGVEQYVVMVANTPQAQDVLFDNAEALSKTLPKGATLLLCSTISPADATQFAKMLKECGRSDIFFVDSPVSGGARRAAQGTLSIMAGASDEAIARGSPLLAEMSDKNKLYIVKGGIGQGSSMKMAHQVLAAIQILATSEALGFAAHLGLDTNAIRDAITSSNSTGWMFENRSPRAIAESYTPPESALTIILKDAGIITKTARLQKFPIPLTSAAEQTYLSGVQRGWAALDDSAMVRFYYERPIANAAQSLSPDEIKQRTALVLQMLQAVHACAAAEAIALARHSSIPLDQFAELVYNAAGNSAMFRIIFESLSQSQASNSEPGIEALIDELDNVLLAAQKMKCPLPLSTAAMSQLLFARQRIGSGKASGLIELWR